jgi:hypothetical protein
MIRTWSTGRKIHTFVPEIRDVKSGRENKYKKPPHDGNLGHGLAGLPSTRRERSVKQLRHDLALNRRRCFPDFGRDRPGLPSITANASRHIARLRVSPASYIPAKPVCLGGCLFLLGSGCYCHAGGETAHSQSRASFPVCSPSTDSPSSGSVGQHTLQ